MTVVVTCDVESRFRGFISSVMVEVASGVYIAPLLSAGARDRIWDILSSWHDELQSGSITMVWKDSSHRHGMGLRQVGVPSKELYEHEGYLLVRRNLNLA